MEISLPPDLMKYIDDKVRAGQFGSAAELIHGAIAAMRDQEELTAEDIAALREEVGVGLAQLDRGEGAEWDVEETKGRLRERIARAKRAS